MGLPYMPMFWGDYWRDTTHLSDAEHVSYLRLISHYWQHGCLPQEDSRLARIAGRSDAEWLDMKPMLQAFFKQCWVHARVDRELQKQKLLHDTNADRAKKAAAARWNRNQRVTENVEVSPDAPSIPQASSEQCLSNAIHSHSHNHNHINKPVRKNIAHSPRLVDSFFIEFWKLYPRRIGKGAAEKAWEKAVDIVPAEMILDAVKSYVWPNDSQFIPYPATWLSQNRWQDEPPPRKMTLAEQFARKAMEFEGEEPVFRRPMIDLIGD